MRFIALPILALLVSSGLAQTTWHVSGNGAASGSGTPNDPFGSIQQAIDAAASGSASGFDTILVSPGSYREHVNFSGKNVHVKATSGPDVTSILGAGRATVTFANAEGADAILEGFTVTHESSLKPEVTVETSLPWGANSRLHTLDFDDDGLQDLIWNGNAVGASGTLWLRSTGTGFLAAQNLGGGLPSFGGSTIAIGDVDGDGLDDIVRVSFNSGAGWSADWYRNQGAGQWTAGGTILPLTPPAPLNGVTDPTLWDVDADGDLDFVYVQFLFGGPAVWVENLGAGSFDLAGPQSLGAAGVGVNRLFSPDDIDGDGLPDLISLATTAIRIQFATGAFHSLSYAGSFEAIASGDVDGDGRAEVFVATGASAEVTRHDWEGSAFQSSVLSTSSTIQHLAVARIDGDVTPDLVAATSSEVVWFPGSGPPELMLAPDFIYYLFPFSAVAGGSEDALAIRAGELVRYAVPSRATTGFGGAPRRSATSGSRRVFGDLDGDGAEDFAYVSGGSTIRWRRNLGNGQFAGSQVLGSTSLDAFDTLVVGDLDGNGVAEVVAHASTDEPFGSGSCIAAYEISVHGPGGTATALSGSFAASNPLGGMCSATVSSVALHVVDIEGDGDEDVLYAYKHLGSDPMLPIQTAVQLLTNTNGTFTSSIVGTWPTVPTVTSLAAGDLDGNGLADVLIGFDLPGVVRVDQLSSGFQAPVPFDGAEDNARLSILDTDGDGDLDVITASRVTNRVRLYDGIGGGSFASPVTLYSSTAGTLTRTKVADFDDDGILDLAAQPAGGDLVLYSDIRTGTGQALILDASPPTVSPSLRGLAAVDYDVDGDLDVWANGSWYRNGDGPGVHVTGGAAPRMRRCVLRTNDGFLTGPGGGAVLIEGGTPTFERCVIAGNTARVGDGGAIHVDGGFPTLDHCTVTGNDAGGGTGGISVSAGGVTIADSIVHGNAGAPLAGAAIVAYSDLEGGWPGIGNLDVDPLFTLPVMPGLANTAGDLTLRTGSPCIGAASSGDDMGALDSAGSVPGAGFSVQIDQTAPGTLDVVHGSGDPGHAIYFVISTNPLNAGGGLGAGWWGGLHVSYAEVVQQLTSGSPPFVDTLDAAGSATFTFPPGSVPPLLSGLTFYCVTHAVDPAAGQVGQITPPVAHTLL